MKCLIGFLVVSPSLATAAVKHGAIASGSDDWLDLAIFVVVCLLIGLVIHRMQLALRSKRLRSWLRPNILRELDPVIVVACLFACQMAYCQRLSPQVVYLALLTLIISSPLFGRFDLPQANTAGELPLSSGPAACFRVLVRWAATVAALLFIAFAFKVGADFSRRVMLTWFVITPIALCVVHAVPRRSSAYAERQKAERPTVERPMLSDPRWGDRKWADIRWTVWGLVALLGIALLLVWLVSVTAPPPSSLPGPYESPGGGRAKQTVYGGSFREPLPGKAPSPKEPPR